MIKKILFILTAMQTCFYQSQSLGRIGSPTDAVTSTTAGTVLMGGGSDVDAAFSWMINKSGGGDFVVIRATGGSAYNSYIYGLGTANSVETFLINSVSQANNASLVANIIKAEAIFFAGGDQNDYITYYKGTLLGNALDYLANTKKVPFGGTSAGMAIQGKIYYDGVTNVSSSEVLVNPYASGTGIKYNDFLQNPYLNNTICDTHFNAKGGTTSNGITGRQGRLMTFLARMTTDQNIIQPKAIACDEKTAVCIDENGLAMVVGLGKAYFLQKYCTDAEICFSGQPLTWTNGAKVYSIAGPGSYTAPPTSAKSVDLNNWNTVTGGAYEYWNVNNGVLSIGNTSPFPAVCTLSTTEIGPEYSINIYPNPTSGIINISGLSTAALKFKIYDASGKIYLNQKKQNISSNQLDLSDLKSGIYFIQMKINNKIIVKKVIKK